MSEIVIGLYNNAERVFSDLVLRRPILDAIQALQLIALYNQGGSSQCFVGIISCASRRLQMFLGSGDELGSQIGEVHEKQLVQVVRVGYALDEQLYECHGLTRILGPSVWETG